MFRSKYLRKLILFSMVLVTIPVISLGGLSYWKAKSITEEKVNQGNMQVLAQTQLKIEQVLQMIDGSLTQFINTPLVNQAVKSNLATRDFQRIGELTEGLYKLQTYDLGIQNIWMVSLDQRWMLDNSGFSYGLSDEALKPYAEMAAIPELSKWVTEGPEGNAVLIKKMPINVVRAPAGLIVARIPNYRLQKLVPPHTEGGATLILDAEYRQLTRLEDPSFSTGVIGQVTRQIKASPAKEGYLTICDPAGSIGVSYWKSDYNAWTYLSLVSIEQITKETRVIGLYTLLISAGIFLFLIVVSLIGANRIYTPIRKIFEAAVGNGESRDESRTGDELEVIGEHIHSLKSSQSKLLAQIQGQTRQLKEFFVRKLMLGELNAQEIEEKAKSFQYELDDSPYCVLTLQIDTLAGTRFRQNDHDLLMFAINNIVSELINADIRMEPVLIGHNQVTLVKIETDKPEEGKNRVFVLAETVQRTVKDILELKVSIGISRFYTGLSHASQAYRQSLEALKYRIRFGEQAILHAEDVLPDQRVQTSFPEWIEKQLIDALKVPDLDKARQLLHEFLTVTLRDNIRHQEYQMILFRLLADLIREIQNLGESLETPEQEERQLFEQLFDLKTVSEIESWFMRQVMEPMVALLNKKWDSQNKNIAERMKDMIHNEFESELTLEICAERLNYHPNYLKTVFRKKTGISFSDYLSHYRMNQAKKWLIETDMKITEIAERLQYQNSQNFIRYFRKLENMTPGEYRKMYRNP